jgi:pyrrolidone-carboxylate peptidase
MNKDQTKIPPNQKDAKIPAAADTQLSDEELNRASGGKPSFSEIPVTKQIDKSTP